MRIGHASGGDAAGIPGDQTGREVRIQDWYGGAWDYVLRAKDDAVAERMARFCEAACANEHIGYSQATRNTLREAARAAGWDAAKITTDCNCDCSSFMSVCAEAAGVDMTPAYSYGNAPWTGIQREKFLATGAFDAFRYHASNADLLRRGDILLDEDRHTIMVLDDGARVHRETEPEVTLPAVGDTVTYHPGNGVHFRPDAVSNDAWCDVSFDCEAKVLAVKPGAARPVLVLLDEDVAGWVALESIKTPAEATAQRDHTVVAGDTMWGISRKYGVSMSEIAAANGMNSIYDVIHPGDKLIIPD